MDRVADLIDGAQLDVRLTARQTLFNSGVEYCIHFIGQLRFIEFKMNTGRSGNIRTVTAVELDSLRRAWRALLRSKTASLSESGRREGADSFVSRKAGSDRGNGSSLRPARVGQQTFAAVLPTLR